MKKFLRKFMDIATNIILVFSIIVLALSGYTAYQYKENPSEAYLFDHKPILVLTGSMEPTMRVNSVSVAQKIEYDEVAVGDIIMYEIEDKLITHRVIEITESGIRTKGDNNNTEDSYLLTEANIKAKVVYIGNWTATMFDDIQTTGGKLRWFGFPVFVLAVLLGLRYTLYRILREEDEDEEVEGLEESTNQETSIENTETDELIACEDSEELPLEDNKDITDSDLKE